MNVQADPDLIEGPGTVYDILMKIKTMTQHFYDFSLQGPDEAVLLVIGILSDENPRIDIAYSIYYETTSMHETYFAAFVRSPDLMRAIIEILNKSLRLAVLPNTNYDGNNNEEFKQQIKDFRVVEGVANWTFLLLDSLIRNRSKWPALEDDKFQETERWLVPTY